MRFVALVVALGLLVVACGDETAVCTETQEPLDPASTLHIIDPATATFLTDPPTSGPHLALPPAVGVFTSPLDPVLQVGMLENGGVMLQYSPPATRDDLERLTGLVGETDAVAPAESLPAPFVATAWTWKLTCADLTDEAVELITDFMTRRRP